MGDARGICRTLQNKPRLDLNSSLNIIMINKPRLILLLGYVVRIEKKRNYRGGLLENPLTARDNPADLDVDGRIILKSILKVSDGILSSSGMLRSVGWFRTDVSGLRIGPIFPEDDTILVNGSGSLWSRNVKWEYVDPMYLTHDRDRAFVNTVMNIRVVYANFGKYIFRPLNVVNRILIFLCFVLS